MSLFVNNIGSEALYQNSGLSEDLKLKFLVESKKEQDLLAFLKTCSLDFSKWRWKDHNKDDRSLVSICIENSWDEVLEWLSDKNTDLIPYLVQSITSKDHNALKILLRCYKGGWGVSISGTPNETLLWHALNEKNYSAANLLIEKGAPLTHKLPAHLNKKLEEDFKVQFYENPYYYGMNGENLFNRMLKADYVDSLAYALVAYYYPRDPQALEVLLNHPNEISFNLLKILIRLGDVEAFNKVLKFFLEIDGRNNDIVENRKANLLHYVLRDFHFSLMGFNFDYIVPRLEILKTLLAQNPSRRVLDKNAMSTYEIAQYLQFYLPESAREKFAPVFAKLLEDPTGFHEIWSIQKLLINMMGSRLNYPITNIDGIHVAAFPTVAQHIQKSLCAFFDSKQWPEDWVLVTPQQKMTVDQCLQRLGENKILKIFTGWTGGHDVGHAINAVVYRNYLFICNRGSGSTAGTTGVAIYKVEDPVLLKESIQLFLDRSEKTENFVVSGLFTQPNIIRLINEYASDQKVGNCVWLSEKMGVYACFIAAQIKEGLSLGEALIPARKLFKQWTEYDRMNLLKAYLAHPYHTRNSTDNEKEGILLKEVIRVILERSPKKLKAKYAALILGRLEDVELRTVLALYEEHEIIVSLKLMLLEGALMQGETSLALSYIDKFADINAENISNETMLHLACRYHNMEMVRALIQRGANPNRVSAKSRCPLEEMFVNGDFTPLPPEKRAQQEDVIKWMVANTSLEELAKEDNIPLFTAVREGHAFGMQEILKKGFDLHTRNRKGETAFHLAAISRSESLGISILSKCLDLEIKSIVNETPLHYAVNANKLAMVQFILDKGANPDAKSTCFQPLDFIHTDAFQPICKELVERGADVNLKSMFAKSHLIHQFIKGNKGNVMEMLKSKKIDIHSKTNEGKSLLFLAVERKMEEVVDTLIKMGVDPNVGDLKGWTPLHVTAMRNQIEICRKLLAAGANPASLTKEQKTPQDYAKENGHAAILHMLQVEQNKGLTDLIN